MAERGPWQAVVITCKTCFTSVNGLDKRIQMAYVGRPDVMFVSVVCLSLRESG